jgi:hypothetical protein
MDYIDSIKNNHCVVSFSQAKSIFYISLWNGVLRDGKVDDIDIQFFEAKSPKIINHSLSFDNHFIPLSNTQLTFLSTIF